MRPVRTLLLLMAASLVGCAYPIRDPNAYTHIIEVPFDAAAARAMLKPGTSIVRGSGFMRQMGGGVVTCAGAEVQLIPATAYARERMWFLYRSADDGTAGHYEHHTFKPDPLEYHELVLKGRCDATGNFTVRNVGEGEFFVVTHVTWFVGNRTQGGHIMKRVTIYHDGSTVDVMLAPR